MGQIALLEHDLATPDIRFADLAPPQGCQVVVATSDEHTGLSLTIALDSQGWVSAPCPLDRLSDTLSRRIADLVLVQMESAAAGIELTKTLRAQGCAAPLVIIVDSAGPEERAAILKAGADECLALPLSSAELVARMHAVHRRPRKAVHAAVIVGSLSLDPENGTLGLPSGDVHITKQQFAILLALARHLDQYIDSERLVRLAQLESNRQDSSRSRVLAVVIYRLRRLLERCDAGFVIESMQGLGYRLARAPHQEACAPA